MNVTSPDVSEIGKKDPFVSHESELNALLESYIVKLREVERICEGLWQNSGREHKRSEILSSTRSRSIKLANR